MKISIYSTAFNVIKNDFDYEDAILNYLHYANEVSLAINTSEDDTLNCISKFVRDNNLNVKIVQTNFSYDDPFCYGKIVNAALQGCTSDICILQDLDERFGGDKNLLKRICEQFLKVDSVKALFVPVINLYGSLDHFKDINFKWYIHKSGLYRGAVRFGIKDDGRPDYNKTSTDELIDSHSNLVPTINIVNSTNNTDPYEYMKQGLPFVYHLGYTDFHKRVKRNKFWKPFWENATGGDENSHSLDENNLKIDNLLKHDLGQWKKVEL
jgi:hypothetical protein